MRCDARRLNAFRNGCRPIRGEQGNARFNVGVGNPHGRAFLGGRLAHNDVDIAIGEGRRGIARNVDELELQAQLIGERCRHIDVDARIAGTRRRRDKRRATIGVDAHAQRASLPNGGGTNRGSKGFSLIGTSLAAASQTERKAKRACKRDNERHAMFHRMNPLSISIQIPLSADLVFAPTLAHWGFANDFALPSPPVRRCRKNRPGGATYF